jgi:chromosome segregation ATPase
MPKTAEISMVERIQRQIAETEQDLHEKRQQLAKQEVAVGDFAEALTLLKNPPRYKPAPGELQPLDALEALLREAESEPGRQQRILSAEAALAFGRQAYARIESEVEQLRDRLTHLKTELEWHENYEPHADKYRAAFPFPPTPEQSRENRLTDLQASIIGHQRRIAQAQEFIQLAERKQRDSAINLPAWSGLTNPETVIENSKVAIAHLEASIQHEKQQPLSPVDPRVEANFRKFVRSRVALEPALTRFLEAQEGYVASLDGLKQALVENPAAAEFGADQMPKPPQTLISLDPNNKIIRHVVEQPVPSRQWW